MPSTVKLHRVLAARPEKVFRAFVESDAVASWLPPNGFICTVHELEAKVRRKAMSSTGTPSRSSASVPSR